MDSMPGAENIADRLKDQVGCSEWLVDTITKHAWTKDSYSDTQETWTVLLDITVVFA
jgi:hypothetical protein